MVGMPDQPHAVKFDDGYANILLRIKSPLALVRWLPLNIDKEIGVGYYIWRAGSMKYDSVFGSLKFEVSPLRNPLKTITKTKIQNIIYNLYISDSSQDLKEASMCERYLPGSVLEYGTIHDEIVPKNFSFTIKVCL